jgi:hypothetical protein
MYRVLSATQIEILKRARAHIERHWLEGIFLSSRGKASSWFLCHAICFAEEEMEQEIDVNAEGFHKFVTELHSARREIGQIIMEEIGRGRVTFNSWLLVNCPLMAENWGFFGKWDDYAMMAKLAWIDRMIYLSEFTEGTLNEIHDGWEKSRP